MAFAAHSGASCNPITTPREKISDSIGDKTSGSEELDPQTSDVGDRCWLGVLLARCVILVVVLVVAIFLSVIALEEVEEEREASDMTEFHHIPGRGGYPTNFFSKAIADDVGPFSVQVSCEGPGAQVDENAGRMQQRKIDQNGQLIRPPPIAPPPIAPLTLGGGAPGGKPLSVDLRQVRADLAADCWFSTKADWLTVPGVSPKGMAAQLEYAQTETERGRIMEFLWSHKNVLGYDELVLNALEKRPIEKLRKIHKRDTERNRNRILRNGDKMNGDKMNAVSMLLESDN